MAFVYHQVVPWGRSFEEVVAMFDLRPDELDRRLLGCGDGPASFNAAMRRRGRRVVSVDPLYLLSRTAVEERIHATFEHVMGQTEREAHRFVWRHIPSIEELGRLRMAAMTGFLADFEAGRREGRYLPAALPRLPFADRAFDLALCGHLLLFYAEQLPPPFHVDAARELCRVAGEVRIFPLVDTNARPSPHLEPLLAEAPGWGVGAELLEVPYEFQRGGNRMLVLRCARSGALTAPPSPPPR